MSRAKDKSLAYNKQLREFDVFDVHLPTEAFHSHPYFQALVQHHEKLLQEFRDKTRDNFEVRQLGEKMLAYQNALINHSSTLSYVEQWLAFLVDHPKVKFTKVLERYAGVDAFCLQEVNDQLLDILFQHEDLISRYRVEAIIENRAFPIDPGQVDDFHALRRRSTTPTKTYGLILVNKDIKGSRIVPGNAGEA